MTIPFAPFAAALLCCTPALAHAYHFDYHRDGQDVRLAAVTIPACVSPQLAMQRAHETAIRMHLAAAARLAVDPATGDGTMTLMIAGLTPMVFQFRGGCLVPPDAAPDPPHPDYGPPKVRI